MPTVVYIHGFLSAPQSFKAQATRAWLDQYKPQVTWRCPALSSYPEQAAECLLDLVKTLNKEDAFVVGSSLGGFWATWLVEAGYVQKAVLINPAVAPQKLVTPLLGQTLTNYYSSDTYCLNEQHTQTLSAYDYANLQRPEAYWLMVQTGDETLPYQQAVEKYRHCRQTVEAGGSHTFEGYENWLPEIAEFFGL